MASTIEALRVGLERLALDPRYHDFFSLIKTARNGAVYGAKVRFPHALVYVALSVSQTWGVNHQGSPLTLSGSMVFLFRSGSFKQKCQLVFRATKKHASNLARFATIYKLSMLALKRFGPTPGKEGPLDSFFAGLLGGYIVFGQRSPRTGKISSVSQQIVIYIFALVCLLTDNLRHLRLRPRQCTKKFFARRCLDKKHPIHSRHVLRFHCFVSLSLPRILRPMWRLNIVNAVCLLTVKRWPALTWEI
ncbi:hypothetical protein NQ176_g9296 [Zarea fungicola]|uniref:Uncharacterized protein n=1 Tax=Zarea fungicola TaxID=93591 RepID=A0ACC1MPI8_9HYPO|nr:hypothetical protein NQ176_g9296 [Lecanicillium fungicola]